MLVVVIIIVPMMMLPAWPLAPRLNPHFVMSRMFRFDVATGCRNTQEDRKHNAMDVLCSPLFGEPHRSSAIHCTIEPSF